MNNVNGRKSRAVFLDRDGVINVNRPDHVKSWDEFSFLPNVLDALRQLSSTDLVVVVVTNQAAIHRQLVDESTVRGIHARMSAAIQSAGGRVDAIYYCPHTPEEACECRKPKPGMYVTAARDLNLDLSRSFVVGDARNDVQAAQRIGAQPILVLTGRDCDHRLQASRYCRGCEIGCVVLHDLARAVEWICDKERVRA